MIGDESSRPEGGSQRVGYTSFAATVEALRAGKVDYALLPAENSIAGSIGELGQLLADSDVARRCHVDHSRSMNRQGSPN